MTRMEICLKYMYRRFRGISTTQKYSTVCMYVLLYKLRAHLHQFYVHTYSTYTYVRMYTLHTPSTCGSVMRLSSRKCYILYVCLTQEGMSSTAKDLQQLHSANLSFKRGYKEQAMAAHGTYQSHLQDLVSNPDQSTLVRNASRSYKGDKDPKVLLSSNDVEAETCPFRALKGDLPHLVRLYLNSLSDLW